MEIVAKLDLINLEINENSPEIILKSNLIEDNLPTATQSRLLEIIKSSLLSTNSKTLKYSIFLLQKIIEKENLIEKFTQTDNHWNNFFLMFETLQEQQLHLVLPQLEIFKELDLFDDFWLEILITKAIQNDNLKTRFKIIEFLLEFKIPSKIIAYDQSFLVKFLQVCTRQTFYQDLLKGSFKSDFGELVAGYISSLSLILSDVAYKNLMGMMSEFLPRIQSRIPSIFILEGLTDLSYKMDQKVYGKLHLLEVVSMISSKLGKSIFKTTKTRALMSITVARFLKLTFNEEKLTVGNVINIFGALVPSNYVYEEIAKVDGALDLLKSLFLADETFNSERLQEEFTDFVSDDSISYGDSEKQFCSGLCAFFTMANGYNAEKLVAKFTENSTSRFYMVILAVSTIPKFNFSLQFKHHIVKVCSFKLRNAKAFDQADLLCRMIANTVQNGQKYPELELLAFNQNQMTDNSNLDLWLYISIKLINTLYGNKSITPSPELVEKHSKYVYYNITVTSKYDAVAIQIFNKSKYQLLLHLLKLDGNHDKFLDYCVEQLGICSFENLEFVFDSLIFLVSSLKFTVPNIDLVSEAIKVSIKRFEESWKISNSWFTMISKFTEFAYSPPVLAQLPISIISTTTILLKWSETRMGIINRVSKCLSAYWISVKDSECLLPWIPTMIDLCYYGPARQSLDIEVRMETLVLHKLSNVDNTDERYETCLWDFNCQDYVVRVDVNHYFMGLSTSSFTWELIKAILARLESKLLKRKNYVNSFNQKISMRLGMSLQVLIGVAPEKNKSELLAGLFRALTYEKVVESMAWIEWGIARLVLGNLRDLQSQFFAFFKECNKVSHCAHSMVLICLQLIPLIEDPVLKSDFTIEAILLSLSWSGNKLYTIRVLTQYLIFKHYFSHPRLENLAYFLDHIKQNQDSQKAFEKIKLYHFFNDFNPLMVSAEFIFKGFLAMMEYSTEERISSLAFVKVCMESGCGCGFDLGYATRKESAALLSRSVRPRIADTNESPQPLDSSSSIDNIFNTSTKSGSDTNPERPHQRKIVSWQNFMLTDIELSGFRNLEVVRPRLQLQIIASLITKPVNLGGLTRTCETFSCGLLCMDTLDVAKDPSFLSTCVSAEKWCPMKEVKRQNLLSYLAAMKSEGWSVIGIEQATTSVKLTEFKFPLKSILLLGKEKEGVPADLLLVCDHIVEIPQSGMIKSLNVHVSGSLVLYEYYRQHGSQLMSC